MFLHHVGPGSYGGYPLCRKIVKLDGSEALVAARKYQYSGWNRNLVVPANSLFASLSDMFIFPRRTAVPAKKTCFQRSKMRQKDTQISHKTPTLPFFFAGAAFFTGAVVAVSSSLRRSEIEKMRLYGRNFGGRFRSLSETLLTSFTTTG